MAFEAPGFSFSLPAGADFSAAAQFRFVDVSATGKAVNPTAGGSVVGVRQNRPPANDVVTVVQSGISIVECGGTITAGDLIQTNGTGQALVSASGKLSVGRALESGVSGVQIAVLLIPAAIQAP